jgi:Fe-S-cluster-containing dehydrogenase component/DMSO reductase anchor subunit
MPATFTDGRPGQPLHDFLAELLAEQGRLQTPVARLAALHDVGPSALQAFRPSLIPLTAPGPGEQYAFEVDLDACSGCKACVVACHALNGLDETEAWRDVGLITGGSRRAPYQQTVTSACHHCADPGCLNGCPVLAYEKDPRTGIVRHLDDQCIGCQYCILKCPYDVPKYNDRLGIVRKCDMCHQRLGAGEAPACAQACPTHAIRIVKVAVTVNGRPRADTSAFLAAAPDPSYTQPTTRYVSKRPQPADTRAADAAVLRPQPPHWPLVLMLTLLPAAIGTQAVAALLAPTSGKFVTYYMTNLGWVAGAAGLAAGVFHLGQPLRAWRIFLGWRRSWLSREALLFGGWFPLALFACREPRLLPPATLTGMAALFCSAMIYADTHRVFWRVASTVPRFFGSAAILGLAAALTAPGAPRILGHVLPLAMVLKLALEARALAPLLEVDNGLHSPARQTARLLAGPLREANQLRVVAALLGGILLPLLLALGELPAAASWAALALCLASELAERWLFFRAVDAPRMPGQPDPLPGGST